MKFLTGILKPDGFHPAEPWWSPALDEDMEFKNALSARFVGLSEKLEQQRRAPDESLPLGEAAELLAHLRASGHRVSIVEGDRVRVEGSPLSPEQVERVKAIKAALIRILSAEQAPEQPGA